MNNTPEVAVKLMTDLPDVIGKDILHLDSKAAKHLGGRFVSDKYESSLENGESLLIMHGTLTGADTPLPLAILVLTVHGDDERNMTLWAEDSEGMNIDSEIFTDPEKVEDALKTLEAKVKVPAKKEPLTDHERIERLERIVEPMERAIKTIQEKIAELKNR